ncbi:MAG: GTPase ObgE [Spirochaetaceae bacterium]|nr:GTPase ObgE [Spirochaetaceae bacterium]
MIKFADEATIEVSSGKGGNGCVAFRREKFVPLGGPAGGDGGRGGDVVFQIKNNLRTLAHLRYKQHFKAKNGCDGEGSNRFGKDGEDVVIPLPPGSVIKDAETGEVIKEFVTQSESERFVFLEGGKGGWGNTHFKTSTNQAPEYAHAGKPGETRTLLIELNIMADIGLVGFPNAGKSSLLDFFTNARPKIAPYPFTTKIPNLGVLHVDQERDIIIADIPGIIEGASEGAGLGIRFLKHISRTAGLLYIIDVSDDNCFSAFQTLSSELKQFSGELAKKPFAVVCNKLDVEGAQERFETIRKSLPDVTVLGMSVYNRQGMDEVRKTIITLADTVKNTKPAATSKKKKTVSAFMAERSVCDTDEIQYPGQEQ